ncbi:hypothetical protein ACHAXS_006025 [Conticribra weissflogii]
MTAASATPSTRTCHVVISLAHLLQQHSLSYDDEKNALLDASVQAVVELSQRATAAAAAHRSQGEVHVVLTGSPRPTFAETNAWLLEAPGSPRGRRTSVDHSPRKASLDDGVHNLHPVPMPMEMDHLQIPTEMEMDEEPRTTALQQQQVRPQQQEDEDEDEESQSALLHDYIYESTHHSSTQNANMNDLSGSPTKTGGSVLAHFQNNRRRTSTSGSSVDIAAAKGGCGDGETAAGGVAAPSTTGPMVGRAVVNAISQTKGLGLHSSRSRLLQGTIDRPLWDQRRWTDGECLFSDLVDRVGLESFENVGGIIRGGADDAAGGGMGSVRRRVSTLGEVGHDLDKTANVSAHLITVPAVVSGVVRWNGGSSGSGNGDGSVGDVEIPGMDESTMDEIARGVLRCLKRRQSPPVTKVYLALPPMVTNVNANDRGIAKGEEVDRLRRELAVKRLSEAWEKLERYNDMIGQPKLMAGTDMEFVYVNF